MKQWVEKLKKQLKSLEESLPEEVLNTHDLELRSHLIHLDITINQLKEFHSIATSPYKVPKGYKWCSDCKALTPHWTNKYSYHTCKVCSNSNYGNGCYNCGWEEPEEDKQLVTDITVHGSGCHYNDQWMGDPYDEDDHVSMFNHAEQILRDFLFQYKDIGYMRPNPKCEEIKNTLKEKNMLKCSCPIMTVYPVTNIYNYRSGYYASMDCSNAMEWHYDVRCPICGDIFHVSDTNC